MSESPDSRLKRITMRSWRRGMKEMDLILGPFADSVIGGFDADTLDAYEALLNENDQDLLAWILGQAEPAADHAPLIAQIAAFARARLTPQG